MAEVRDRAPFIEKTNTLGGRFVREAKVTLTNCQMIGKTNGKNN